MKLSRLLLALAITVNIIEVPTALIAQSGDPELTAANPTSASSAVFDFGDGTLVRRRKRESDFQEVSVNAGQSINIKLQFAPTMAGQELVAGALDGGAITAPEPPLVVDADGNLNFTFRAPILKGYCRVAIQQSEGTDVLQFWVIDPAHPEDNPPADG